jgi:hypothetical protein
MLLFSGEKKDGIEKIWRYVGGSSARLLAGLPHCTPDVDSFIWTLRCWKAEKCKQS